MDIMLETLLDHNKKIADIQRMLKLIPRLKEKIESELYRLQSEAEIMKNEINSGKSLS